MKALKAGKIISLTALILSAVIILAGCGSSPAATEEDSEQEPESIELFAMDTYMTLTAYGDNAGKALAESEKEIKRIDAMLSTGSSDSEISRLNNEKSLEVSEETFDLIKRAKEIGEDTGKVFDISVYPVMQAWGFTDKNYKVPEKDELAELLKRVDVSKVKLDEEKHTVAFDDDRHLITSRGPATAMPFAFAIVDALGGDSAFIKERFLYNMLKDWPDRV